MKDIIRMNQLAGLITESQAQKMMEILNEVSPSTDLELKSKAKEIFSTLKKYGLKPNYTSGDIKLDKTYDSVVGIVEDTKTGTGLIKVNIWDFAVSKNKIDMKKLNSDIVQVLGNEFENKSGQMSSGSDTIYTMLIKKK